MEVELQANANIATYFKHLAAEETGSAGGVNPGDEEEPVRITQYSVHATTHLCVAGRLRNAEASVLSGVRPEYTRHISAWGISCEGLESRCQDTCISRPDAVFGGTFGDP